MRPQLTEDQKRIVGARDRLIFVESAPGSGKTTVAAELFGVARLIHASRDPRAVVAVSFARTATSELRNRVRRRWGGRVTSGSDRVDTMDGLHRSMIDFLLGTRLIRWPGGPPALEVIDSWERQRGATRLRPGGRPSARWELSIQGGRVALAHREVERPCFGMPYGKKDEFVEALRAGVVTHDEVRQLVGLALGSPRLGPELDAFIGRTFSHLIVDEVFDVNGLDARLIERFVVAGSNVALLGDPWQALYEWRGARPDLVHRLLDRHSFRRLPMLKSFRFVEHEVRQLALDLRQRRPVTLDEGGHDAEVVLASAWDDLLRAGSDVIPLSFGRLECQTDASIALILDCVARTRMGIAGLGIREAMRCLRRDPESVDLTATLDLLRDTDVPIEDVLAELRLATRVAGTRRPALPRARRGSRIVRLQRLREWLVGRDAGIPGLSFHQAKGQQWRRVDVALDPSSLSVLARGLDPSEEDHRKLYVALTRGSHATRLRRIDTA